MISVLHLTLKGKNMSSEKIAFMFPAAGDKQGNEGPILNFQCEKFPVNTKITVGVAFIGLKQLFNYLINIDFLDKNGQSVLINQPNNELPIIIGITADDADADPSDVPGFLRAVVTAKLMQAGVYVIKCSIARSENPTDLLDVMESRFRAIPATTGES